MEEDEREYNYDEKLTEEEYEAIEEARLERQDYERSQGYPVKRG